MTLCFAWQLHRKSANHDNGFKSKAEEGVYLRLADGRGWVLDDAAAFPEEPSVVCFDPAASHFQKREVKNWGFDHMFTCMRNPSCFMTEKPLPRCVVHWS